MAKGPKRPTRDEFQLEELGERLVEAYQEKTELLLTVWNWEEPVRGRIVTMDSRLRLVHVEDAGQVVKVPFLDIMKVDSPRY
ncbi:MAG: YolD-like family protein [Candidatus Pristimantibacillus sp.]